MARIDNRKDTELRSVKIYPYYLDHPHGSALIEMGLTKVLCTAMVEDSVPRFMKGTGNGWLTAEYGMLPAATLERNSRPATRGRPNGRSQEIQRLIGRVLRAGVNMDMIGERTIWVDCDVLQADGGTRTAAITAGFTAVVLAMKRLLQKGIIRTLPVKDYIAAVSVGIIKGNPILDLCYEEDSRADVDMNVVMASSGRYIEIQGTAEREPFNKAELDRLLEMAQIGINRLIKIQKEILEK